MFARQKAFHQLHLFVAPAPSLDPPRPSIGPATIDFPWALQVMYVAFLLPPHPPLQSFLSPVLRFFLSSRNLLMVLCRTCEINKFDFKGKHTPPYLYSRQNLNLNEHGTAIPHTSSIKTPLGISPLLVAPPSGVGMAPFHGCSNNSSFLLLRLVIFTSAG